MNIFIVGITSGVGRLTAEALVAAGHSVSGLVRRPEQAQDLAAHGIEGRPGDLVADSIETLAEAMRGSDVVVYSAGSSATADDAESTAVDGDGPGRIAQAMVLAGVDRFYLVSAFPEAGRGRAIEPAFEHYMAEKKRAEVEIVRTELDWLILRPSTLIDAPAVGSVDLGLAVVAGRITRADVAATLVALIDDPVVTCVILEVTGGSTPIADAVDALTN